MCVVCRRSKEYSSIREATLFGNVDDLRRPQCALRDFYCVKRRSQTSHSALSGCAHSFSSGPPTDWSARATIAFPVADVVFC